MDLLRRPRTMRSASQEDRVRKGLQMWKQEMPGLDSSGKAVCGRVVALASVMNRVYNDALGEFDLKYPEYGVLATLRASGAPFQMTQKQLMATILFSSGGLSNLLARLEKKKYILRENDQNDRRVTHVRLTPFGVATAEQAMAVQSQAENDLCAGLEASERQSLIMALGKLLSQTS